MSPVKEPRRVEGTSTEPSSEGSFLKTCPLVNPDVTGKS